MIDDKTMSLIEGKYGTNPVAKSVATLAEAMKDDEYAIGWQATLVMAIFDNTPATHAEANKAAGIFIKQLFGRDTSTLV